VSSWAQAGVTIFGEKLLWTDLLGNVFSLATVWLAIRRTIGTWPVQLAGAAYVIFCNWTDQYRHRRSAELKAVAA
jgi:nicotinamide riboside transporter PnuC